MCTLRRLILLIGMVIFLGTSVFSTHAQSMHKDLAGYWQLDEGEGDGTEDGSGNGNDGEIKGNVQWVDAKFGSGLEFDGSGGSTFIVPNSDGLTITGALTIEGWIYPTKKPQKGGFITKYKGAGDNRGYMIDFYDSDLRFYTSADGTRDSNIGITTTDWEPEQWYHAAGVFDGSDMYFYVNGELVGSKAKDTPVNASTAPLEFGNSWEETVFTGIIDEIRIWSSAKSAEQIQTLMKGPEAILAIEAHGKLAVTWGDLKAK